MARRFVLAPLIAALAVAPAGCAGPPVEDDDATVPDDDTQAPDDDTQAPDDDSQAPDDDTVVPDDDTAAPEDGDGDGHVPPSDCDDADPGVHPGAEEAADGVDNDCDGESDEGTALHDDDGDGATEAGGDCDDADPEVHPGAAEIAHDGIDQDCDGHDLTDADGDGFPGGEGPDCDDADPAVNPVAEEVDGDGVDSDCDGHDDVPPAPPGEYCLDDANVLEVPGRVDFNLTGTDASGAPAPAGGLYDDVELAIGTGETVILQMRSYDFDPRFALLSAACDVVATSEDIQPGWDDDDRLEFTAPTGGVYTVVASTAVPGWMGAYSLSAFAGSLAAGEACGYQSSTLAYGEVGAGILDATTDPDDGPSGAGAPLDDWEFQGALGDEVIVQATSSTLDLAIWLLGPDCAPLAEGGGGGAGWPASLTATLPADGPYTVYVSTAASASGAGSYELEIGLAGP